MKVIKYNEFIKENNLHDTPENYISIVLNKLKKKIDKIFDYKEDTDDGDVLKPEELERVKSDKMSFKDLGVRIESSEMSKYSRLYDSLTVKFSDDQNTYTLILMIDIKEAIPEDKEKDFDPLKDIKKCYMKFKKYDLDTFEILGQLSRNVKIKDIDEDFIIDLKIEIDDMFDEGGDELEIESE
jgi:hypothetical protein